MSQQVAEEAPVTSPRGVRTVRVRSVVESNALLALLVLVAVFFSVLLILCHITIKTFDLVVAMTAGGPGTSSSLPAIFMYTFSFNRGQLGVGAASSMMMLATVVAVLVPLMYLESRSTRNA